MVIEAFVSVCLQKLSVSQIEDLVSAKYPRGSIQKPERWAQNRIANRGNDHSEEGGMRRDGTSWEPADRQGGRIAVGRFDRNSWLLLVLATAGRTRSIAIGVDHREILFKNRWKLGARSCREFGCIHADQFRIHRVSPKHLPGRSSASGRRLGDTPKKKRKDHHPKGDRSRAISGKGFWHVREGKRG